MSVQDIDSILADEAWWERVTECIEGWYLLGFSFRHSATFVTDEDEILNLTGKQAQQIVDTCKHDR